MAATIWQSETAKKLHVRSEILNRKSMQPVGLIFAQIVAKGCLLLVGGVR